MIKARGVGLLLAIAAILTSCAASSSENVSLGEEVPLPASVVSLVSDHPFIDPDRAKAIELYSGEIAGQWLISDGGDAYCTTTVVRDEPIFSAKPIEDLTKDEAVVGDFCGPKPDARDPWWSMLETPQGQWLVAKLPSELQLAQTPRIDSEISGVRVVEWASNFVVLEVPRQVPTNGKSITIFGPVSEHRVTL